MRSIGIFAVLLVATVNCQFAYADKSDEYANIHSVGVISRIGDTLTLKRLGIMLIPNTEELPISDWGIDEMVSASVAVKLSPRFAIKPIDTTGLQSTTDLKSFIQSLPSESAADAYIIISKMQSQDLLGDSKQYLTGLGLYRHDLIFGGHNDAMYAFYRVSVMDAKTGKQIDYGSSRLSDSVYLNMLPAEVPSDAANWVDTIDTMTDAQKQAVKTQMLQLIQTSLPYALKSANLISTLPAK